MERFNMNLLYPEINTRKQRLLFAVLFLFSFIILDYLFCFSEANLIPSALGSL